ncbi:MAG TPA: putative DNA binding domain-containing protein [Polyangiaceae bacterium LLY-WYZ-15_(1-7)]|nr:ATPase [Sandaracinus sp.]HJK93564.1 putative DNA binding domain-containing protein [Polyangiaceae bacterium LLY-WYZ-15_(1-7)]MBJ72916.1 ATPase [Sandaracinus sp.]HJL00449.1 putative DNA binding domain-containing protein [Polyangiaceae bacterium LLY-WYZ-15_(1-7)]HJL07090.1 putative DNA binding domain-containing protein [Polyangiaceae bacterium LLY-WYZ-15_(1-7)]
MTRSIPAAETLTIEFKSDQKRLSDAELAEAIVCLANTEGGSIYLGVEDDGRVTGLHPSHQNVVGLPAMVANHTSPSVHVRVERLEMEGRLVARIEVPKAREVVATSQGTMKRRRIGSDGRPECVPMLPGEISRRLSDLGAMDASAQPVSAATAADLDPVERARLRQFVDRFHGERALLDLSDGELDGALGLVDATTGLPTLAGLLLLGRDEAIRRLVPTHEVAFQVLEGEEVRYNEFSRAPLLRVVEWIETQFKARNREKELQVGLFRVGVPRVDLQAFREAVANALVHRDYTRLGAVHVKLDDEELTLSNPGGFVEGVSPQNILTTPPRPRNPVLADAFKRIGLAERTGRGVDLIYRQVLRFGRPAPDYSRSDATTVVLRLPAADTDLQFIRAILEAERRAGAALPIESLIVLSRLREVRRMTTAELAEAMQRPVDDARRKLGRLVEAGLIERRGNTKARTYMLARDFYAEEGAKAEYTRQVGLDRARQEELVLNHAAHHGSVARKDVLELCRTLTPDQATQLLARLVRDGRLRREGVRRWARYYPVTEEPS